MRLDLEFVFHNLRREVEKVVKPPQRPVIAISRHSGASAAEVAKNASVRIIGRKCGGSRRYAISSRCILAEKCTGHNLSQGRCLGYNSLRALELQPVKRNESPHRQPH